MVRTERVRTSISGVDGTGEHELEIIAPHPTRQIHFSGESGTIEDGQQTIVVPVDPPPPYEENDERNLQVPGPITPISAPDQGFLFSTRARRGMMIDFSWYLVSYWRWALVTLFIAMVVGVLIVIVVPGSLRYGEGQRRIRPRNLPENFDFEDTGKAPQSTFRRPDVQASSTAFSVVSGLYIIPTMTGDIEWLQPKTVVFSDPRGESSRDELGGKWPISNAPKVEDTVGSTEPKEELGTSISFEEPFESVSNNRQRMDNFHRWGVETLYRLHRRAVSHVMQVEKAWCIGNTCSTAKKLKAMCNDTGKDASKKHKKDRFEQQECDWCWDKIAFPNRNPMQEAEIERHCDNVSHHAAIFLVIVCSLLLLCAAFLTCLLVMRMLSHRKKAKAANASRDSVSQDKKVGELPWYLSVLKNPRRPLDPYQEEKPRRNRLQKQRIGLSNRTSMNARKPASAHRVPIMPPAISSRVLSDNQAVSQERRSGLRDSDAEDAKPGIPRKSSKRSRAVSSGSQHIPLSVFSRKPFMVREEGSEAAQEITSTTQGA